MRRRRCVRRAGEGAALHIGSHIVCQIGSGPFNQSIIAPRSPKPFLPMRRNSALAASADVAGILAMPMKRRGLYAENSAMKSLYAR